MHDHTRSWACLISTKIPRYDERAGSPPGIYVLTLLHKVTKTGNRPGSINLATPAGFNPHDFKEYSLKLFLATNLACDCSTNLAFYRVFKYIRLGVKIASPTTLTQHLQWLGKSTVDNIRTCQHPTGKLSLAAETWTSPNHLAF